MDKKHLKFIKAIEDLRTIIMKSTEENEVDFLLESLHEKGEAIRRANEKWNTLQVAVLARTV